MLVVFQLLTLTFAQSKAGIVCHTRFQGMSWETKTGSTQWKVFISDYYDFSVSGKICVSFACTYFCIISKCRFNELCAVLEPGKPPKADKVAILSDATRLLNHLRSEAEKLKKSNESIQDNIKNLKVITVYFN